VTSELTLAECLVKPLSMKKFENSDIYLQSIQNSSILEVVPIHRMILIEAANLRAATGCRLPDAIHLATAKTNQCDIFITNDRDIKKNAPEQVVLLPELT
jgi:predicted nucleic acid-binding protein